MKRVLFKKYEKQPDGQYGYSSPEIAEFLTWGISYEELGKGVGQFTVAFIMLQNGKVEEVHPSNIEFIVDEKQQKIEAAASELLESLGCLVSLKDWKDEYGKDEHYLKEQPLAWKRANDAIRNATES